MLFKSKSLWTAVLDAVIGISVLIVSNFFPDYKELLISIWAILQPLALVVIAHFAIEPVRALLFTLKDISRHLK